MLGSMLMLGWGLEWVPGVGDRIHAMVDARVVAVG